MLAWAADRGTSLELIVAELVRGDLEVLVGFHRDPVFGPTCLVGLGGVWAEFLDVVDVHVGALDEATAGRFLDRSRVGRMIAGARGGALDRDGVVRALCAVSRLGASLAGDHRDRRQPRHRQQDPSRRRRRGADRSTYRRTHAMSEPIVSTLRVRIGQEEAHYGGNLVEGARVLKLFGDIVTEVAIITDGDEGLFVGYDKVEFLAPVYAGDFLEVTGTVTRVGNTSRTVQLEARKVIASRYDDTPSGADVLDEPVVVVRAIGTTVVPVKNSRGPRGKGRTAA